MQYKYLTIGLFMLIILAGCTQQSTQQYEPINTEVSCPPQQEICVLGSPGLLNELSIYSDSDTTFSIILRNNLEGDEARNVEVKLKNLSPFYVVEGYELSSNYTLGGITLNCELNQGLWKPDEIRQSLYVPEPQFISDLGLPFASKMLDIMYPNEEVEFLWSLSAPSRQEIANVAYEHSIEYEVSYDYKSSILQTIYAISEQEYQRVLSLNEDMSSRRGTMTSSIGALNVASNIEEPIRVSGVNSQFSITYKVNNKRSGIPLNPALFVFQYPEGTDFVGAFSGKDSLNSYGYIDMKAAAEYYENLDDNDKLICLPDEFDKYDQRLSEFYSENVDSLKKGKNICITYDEVLDYIIRNFKDLEFNRTSPNLVLKFLYPINLLNEMNYLYFPMTTIENVDVSKYYSFRLKAKYRYSFSGKDDIIIIPSEKFYDPASEKQSISFFGDMGFNLEKKATDYVMSDETQKMTKGDYLVDSSVFELNNGNFLQLIKLNSIKPAKSKSCSSDSDCSTIISNAYCDINKGICNYTSSESVTTSKILNEVINPSAKVDLKPESKIDIGKNEALLQFDLDQATYCDKGPLTANLFINLISGNFSFYIKSGNQKNNIQIIRTLGEGFYTISPLLLNCSTGAENTLILNSTAESTSVDFYDFSIVNNSRIINDTFLTRGTISSGYFKLNLNELHNYYSIGISGSSFNSGDELNHYINYKIIFGEIGKINYALNTLTYPLSSVSWKDLALTYKVKSDITNAAVSFNNTVYEQQDAVIYFSTKDVAVSNFYSLNHSVINYVNKSFYEPYFYNFKIGYSPREGFLKKLYDNSESYILLNSETYYVNHLPYSAKTSVLDRSAAINHELIVEGDDVLAKINNISKFIDYKSFIELNEVNILEPENGLVNVFSDSDLIGYQLKDYDYTTPAYTNIIPMDMKLMNYNQGESVFFKRFNIGSDDDALSFIMLYSDKLTLATNRLMFYIIDHSVTENNPVRSNYFNISLIKGNNIPSTTFIALNSTIIPISVIKKDAYEQISSLMNLKSISGVVDCSKNYNSFGQEVNKKPILKIDFNIKYGGNSIDPTTFESLTGTIIVGDYNNIGEINSAYPGLGLNENDNFVKGVVSICKV